MRLTDGGSGGFCNFLEKNSHFNDSWMTFPPIVDPFVRTRRGVLEDVFEDTF